MFCFITFDTFLRSNIKYQMLKVIHQNVNGLFFFNSIKFDCQLIDIGKKGYVKSKIG